MLRRTVSILTIAGLLATWLLAGVPAVSANRFGPPYMDRVTADQTTIYATPDTTQPVGPVGNGAILVVVGQSGDDWIQTTTGFVSTKDVQEDIDPWVADVVAPVTPVYAKPNANDVIRMDAHQGDLLRVTGVSHGMQGDANIWWSTTEGYVALDALQPSQNSWASDWTVPDGSLAINGWWGATTSDANVRAGPTTDAPVVGQLPGGNLVKVLSDTQGQNVQGSPTWYRIDGGRYAGGYIHSSLVKRAAQPQANTTPPPDGSTSGRWIVVDRARHSLTLVDNGQPTFVTYVALGVAGRDTPAGTYSTWGKYRADDMTSTSVADPGGYYDLPNVPNTQYYKDGGFAIHGTYWHDEFGTDQSHGCVNVTWTDGRYLFDQTQPQVPADQVTVPTGQPATDVVII
jgi:lipoprotein-anchoring transpeptidase ErfK/SrfK